MVGSVVTPLGDIGAAFRAVVGEQIALPMIGPSARVKAICESGNHRELQSLFDENPRLMFRFSRCVSLVYDGAMPGGAELGQVIAALPPAQVRGLLLVCELMDLWPDQNLPGLDMMAFRKRSIGRGWLAGRNIDSAEPEAWCDAFVAGTLLRLALPWMWSLYPHVYAGREWDVASSEELRGLERRIFGFDHVEVGASALTLCGAPPGVVLCLQGAEEVSVLCRAVDNAEQRLNRVEAGVPVAPVQQVLGLL